MKHFLLLAVVLYVLPAALPAKDPVGVGNFHQVNEHVFRGAQPSAEGFANLAKMGIKTVIDLREPGRRSNEEKRLVKSLGMRYIPAPMNGFSAPAPEDLAKVLAVLEDNAGGSVFVHCRRGADRTGTVIACYRIQHDGWANGKALAEARTNHMSPLERAMQGFIRTYHAPAAAGVPVAPPAQ